MRSEGIRRLLARLLKVQAEVTFSVEDENTCVLKNSGSYLQWIWIDYQRRERVSLYPGDELVLTFLGDGGERGLTVIGE